MRDQSVDSAPVESVGGNRGRWPDQLEEITVGDEVEREVRLDDGSTETRLVEITEISQMCRDDGTETEGYVVSYTREGSE